MMHYLSNFASKIILGYYKYLKKGIHFGKNVRIEPKTKINNQLGVLYIGNNVHLRSLRSGYHSGMPFPCTFLLDKKDAYISVGNNCRLNGVYIHSQKSISIGNNCVIAAGTNIIDSNGHVTYSFDRTKDRDLPEQILIGDNVWIGLNVVILKGTIIGDNSVVGAGSIVKGVFPKNALIVGNPAKVVKILNI